MATYAIGDVQGCLTELQALIELLHYDPSRDKLWLTGDLVNRGPDSLAVLRYVKALQPAPVIVLGNHDLHLLAIEANMAKPKKHDTLEELLGAVDLHELCAWLRQQPLYHYDEQLGFVMTHAGILPAWDLTTMMACANEVHEVLRGKQYADYFKRLYGNKPYQWQSKLRGWSRLRFITNALTRMRYCYAGGELNLTEKGTPSTQDPCLIPWFKHPQRQPISAKILFGHWASLNGFTKVSSIIALDTGCVWGNKLTAYCLETGKRVSVAAKSRK